MTDTKPWTDVHAREALRRTYEIAAGLVADGGPRAAAYLVVCAAGCAESEDGWRSELADDEGPRLTVGAIDREVRRVRALAEGRLVRVPADVSYRIHDGDAWLWESGTTGETRWVGREASSTYNAHDAEVRRVRYGATLVPVRCVTRIRRTK